MPAGKKYREASSRYDKNTPYSASEALELVKTLASANFDETIDAAFRLGIDPRKADQNVRGTVALPHGTGKAVRVAVFCSPDKQRAVTEFKGGRIEYRNDRYGNVHVTVGKASFEVPQLLENLAAVAAELVRAKPAAAKGRYIRSLTVSSTMAPGVKVDVGRIEELTA